MIAAVVIGVVALVLLLPVASDVASVVTWLIRRNGRPAGRAAGPPSRLLYLIPAHDEEVHIDACVRSALAQRYTAGRIDVVVVADNCSDRTVDIARAAGVTCLERHDLSRRGKPHALRWAFDRLDLAPYDAVVILDADAVVARDHAAALDRAGPLRRNVVQGYNDVANKADSPLTRMAAVFAAGLFRAAFPLKVRAGLNIPLSAGLCLGVDVLAGRPWREESLSEDVELYARLTGEGVHIALAPDAHLYAQEARTLRQARSQRSRWLAGRLDVLLRHGPVVLRSQAIGWRQKLDLIAEIGGPGPALSTAIAALLLVAVLVAHPAGAPWLEAAVLLPVARHVVYGTVGLVRDTEPRRALGAFAFLPVYAAWRTATALRSFTRVRRGQWVRTER